jgi:hypothetical protein
MKRFIFILVAILSTGAFAQKKDLGTIVHGDKIVFKIKNELYFASEFEHIREIAKGFQCLYPDSTLLKITNIGKNDLTSVEAGKLDSKEGLAILNKMIMLLKVVDYVSRQKVVLPDDLWKNLLKRGGQKGCWRPVRNFKTIPAVLKGLVRGELFLNARFSKSAFLVTPREIEQMKKEFPRSSLKGLERRILMLKVEEGLKVFKKSLDQQIHHELFIHGH